MVRTPFLRRACPAIVAVLLAAWLAPPAFAQEEDGAALIFHESAEGEATREVRGCTFWVRGAHLPSSDGELTVLYEPDSPGDPTIVRMSVEASPEEDGDGFAFVAGPLSIPADDQSNPARVHAFVRLDVDEPEPVFVFSEDVLVFCDPHALACPEVVVDPSRASIRLSWEPVPFARTYVVERDGELVAFAREASFVDENVTEGETYRYRVGILGARERSCPLVEATAVPLFGSPGAAAVALASGLGALLASRRRRQRSA